MKYKITLYVCMFFVFGSLWSQATPQKEQLFVHLNNTVFLTGEYLFYKAYVTNTTKNEYSKMREKVIAIFLYQTPCYLEITNYLPTHRL